MGLQPPIDLCRVFPGDSEMARRMRDHDWASTSLGPVDGWPDNLRLALSICLTSRFPMQVWWGPDLILFYNDSYISFLGPAKHPVALGRSGRQAWAEIWDEIGPIVDRVFCQAEANWSEDMLMFFDRIIRQEEVYVTFSYSPILGPAGDVEGMFCASSEVTEKIVGSRRLETLRKLGQAAECHDYEEACAVAAKAIGSNPHDVPFAGIYLLDCDGGRAVLAASVNDEPVGIELPHSIEMGSEVGQWPLAKVLRTRKAITIILPAPRGTHVQAWPTEAEQALVLPIRAAAYDAPAGFLIAGISTRRPLDPGYLTFLDLVAGQIGSAIADVRAYDAERRKAEALAELDRAKTHFFSNISHEFRTPISLMLGPIEEAAADASVPLPPVHARRLQMAHRNGQRLLKLVNILLDFARIEAGRLAASFVPTDLACLTAELGSNFQSACDRAGLRLIIDCPPLSAPVQVDRDMWEKIVLNLLSNAFKFTLEGEIRVELREEGDDAHLTISDTGIGITETELPRIFDRFHRVEDGRGRTQEGTGIGLAFVRELVELHGGTITVESTIGRGSRFHVVLPDRLERTGQVEAPGERPSEPVNAPVYVEEALRWLPEESVVAPGAGPSASGGCSFRVLVADDNADMRDYLRTLLLPYGEIELVRDGAEAMKALAKNHYDLLLSDIMMPNVDGVALLRHIRADPALRFMPVILLSARAGKKTLAEGLRAGADDYLVKPFTASDLVTRIGTCLSLARMRSNTLAASEAKYRGLSESLEEGYCVVEVLFDAANRAIDYRFLEVNPAFSKQAEFAAVAGQTLRELAPEYESHWFETLGSVALTGEPVRFENYASLLGQRWYDVFAFRVGDPEKRTVGALFRDITARKRAGQVLQESEERFQQFGRSSLDVLWIQNADTHAFEYVSPGFESMYGLAREEVLENGVARWFKLVHPDDQDHVRSVLMQVRGSGKQVSHEFRIIRASDGEVRWIENTSFPIHDGNGVKRWFGGITKDITASKQTAERLQMLVAELQHRTRNLIGVINAVADRTIESSATMDAFGERFRARLGALARVNSLLSRLNGSEKINFDELIRTELAAHGAVGKSGEGAQVTLDGPDDVQLRSSTVQIFGLALHELATNALKHGALSTPNGMLKISWAVIVHGNEPRLCVNWRERGVTMPTVEGMTQGYGRELIERALPYQLQADIEYALEPDGVRCAITLPIAS